MPHIHSGDDNCCSPSLLFLRLRTQNHIRVQTFVRCSRSSSVSQHTPQRCCFAHRRRIDGQVGDSGGKSVQILDALLLTCSKQLSPQLVVADFGDDAFEARAKQSLDPSSTCLCVGEFTRMSDQGQHSGVEKDGSLHGNNFRAAGRFESRLRFKSSISPVSSSQSAAIQLSIRAIASAFSFSRVSCSVRV